MRILQVVTYISPDGAYGGPVRVALNQAKILRDLRHEVVVAAAAGGFDGQLPEEFDGFPVRLFPARRVLPKTGFAGLTSPGLLAWLAHAVQSADVVHVHLARDLVTLPAAALALLGGKPLVVQTHGMIDRTDNPLAGPLDRFLTRLILHRARTVLYLTERERQDLTDVAGKNLAMAHLPNGVGVPAERLIEQESGPQTEPEVLFLARLHPRKRPMHVVRAAQALAKRNPQARFALVGPDEGEGSAVRSALQTKNESGRITWSGSVPPEKVLERMRQAAVYVLPSTDEPFPMAVLEAMSLGIPVIVTDSCGLAQMIRERRAGIVCNAARAEFEGSLGRLLQDADLRRIMGQNARHTVENEFSMESIGRMLVEIYRSGKTV